MIYVIYIGIILFSVTQSATTKLYNKACDNSVFFNLVKSASAFTLMALLGFWNFTFHTGTMFFGLGYGVSLCVSLYSGYKALCLGPMALTSLIVSFSVTIPLIYGFVFCEENFTKYKLLGFAFLVVAIIFANLNKKKSQNVLSGKWLMFVMFTFITNGICSVLQKMHQTMYPEKYTREFMIFAMLFCTVVYFVIAVLKIKPADLKAVKGKHFPVISGGANALANYLTLALAGFENATVLFPAITAGTIFASLICGVVVFREKLKFNHYIAIASGITAVVFLKI